MGEILDRLWEKAVLARVPLTGAFELLPVCNLQCKMCYVRKSKTDVDAAGGLIPTEQWLDWAKQARDLGMLFPLLTGGEPFLHPDLFKILADTLQMGMQPSINSNGTLIDETAAKWLGSHLPRRINITLYGGSPESYQTLCGNGAAFDQVHRAVEWLIRYHVPIKFNVSVTPDNFNDIDAMMAFAKSVDRPIEFATYMFPPIRRNESMVGQNHRLSPEKAAEARVKANWLQAEPEWFQGQAVRFSRFVPITDEMLQKQMSSSAKGMTCRAGRSSFWIDWQGNMVNCGMYPSVKYHIGNQSLEGIWKKVVEDTDAIRYSPACTNCPNFRLCHSCIAMVYNECGDPNGRPDYLCRMNAASARCYAQYAEMLPPPPAAAPTAKQEADNFCDFEP